MSIKSILADDFLKWLLMFSALFHVLVVLGISFVMPDRQNRESTGSPLKITLVNTRSETAPEQARTLAQFDNLGENSTTLIPAVGNLDSQADIDSQSYNTDQSDYTNLAHQSEDPVLSQSGEQIRRQISLAYLNSQAKPRERYFSERSKANKYAPYIEKWRLKVERIGNLKYPEEAKRKNLEGSLILDVSIHSSGELHNIRVLESSGQKVLDDAAKRIVRIAAPFEPFPDSFAHELDVLHIIRTWEFEQGRILSNSTGVKTP